MASIARDPNGRRRILFVAADGKRRTIRLGKVPQSAAEAVKLRIEQLVSSKVTGHALETDTARWVAECEPAMADKLAAVGLIPKRGRATLKAFLDTYLTERTDIKPRTAINLGYTAASLVEFFGRGLSLAGNHAGRVRPVCVVAGGTEAQPETRQKNQQKGNGRSDCPTCLRTGETILQSSAASQIHL